MTVHIPIVDLDNSYGAMPSMPLLVSPLSKKDNSSWYYNWLTNNDARTLDMKFDCEDNVRTFEK